MENGWVVNKDNYFCLSYFYREKKDPMIHDTIQLTHSNNFPYNFNFQNNGSNKQPPLSVSAAHYARISVLHG